MSHSDNNVPDFFEPDVTDERKEGQHCYDKMCERELGHSGAHQAGCCEWGNGPAPAQPQPRGSEALRELVAKWRKAKEDGDHALFVQVRCDCADELEAALAAATAPTGSEALATKVLYLAKTMNESNIWANRNEIMELCEGAAATAPATGSEALRISQLEQQLARTEALWDEANNTILALGVKLAAATAERTPPDEDAAFYKWLGSYDDPHPTPKTIAKAAWFAALADRQPAPPQPEAPEKEKP